MKKKKAERTKNMSALEKVWTENNIKRDAHARALEARDAIAEWWFKFTACFRHNKPEPVAEDGFEHTFKKRPKEKKKSLASVLSKHGAGVRDADFE